jgi:hypothetical protein
MSEPNPDQFAKVVLWHLAGLRAELASMSTRLDTMEARVWGVPSEEVQKARKRWIQDQQNKLYLEGCSGAGLKKESSPLFPPADEGGRN